MLKKIVALLLLSILMTSCLPGLLTGMDKEQRKELRYKKKCQRKFDKLVKACPQYLELDTANIPMPVSADSQRIEGNFLVNSPSDSLKEILRHYQFLSDSLVGGNDSLMSIILTGLGEEIIRYVDRYKFLTDTLSIDTAILIKINGQELRLTITIGAYQKTPRSISPFVYVPESDFDLTFPCPDSKLVRPKLSTQEMIFEWLKTNYLLLIISILVVLLVTYIKKNWFPSLRN